MDDFTSNPWVYGPFAVIGAVSTFVVAAGLSFLGTLWLVGKRAERKQVKHARRQLRELNRRRPEWMSQGL